MIFANNSARFTCLIGEGSGIQWLFNERIYLGAASDFDPNVNAGVLHIANSSTFENGTSVQCRATDNGTILETSRKIVVYTQG